MEKESDIEQEEKERETRDTVPTSLKRDFFENKTPPCLFKDYDVIGFSVDHCLVKYNMIETVKLAVSVILLDLHNHFKYPREVLDFDYDKNLNFYITNVVWDLKHGTILKLGDDRVITSAVLGYEALTESQIISLYGDPPVFQHLKFFKDSRLETKHPHWTLSSPQDCYKIPAILHVTQLIRSQKIKKTIEELAFDLKEIEARQFISHTPEKVNNVMKYGMFYPRLLKEVKKFIMQDGYGLEVKEVLEKLRDKGKGTFCVADGHVDWTVAVMEASLGPDWLDLFDMVICNAKRPLFSRSEQPFYTLDYEKPNLKGKKICNIDDLLKVKDKILTEGNTRLVTNFFQKKKEKYNLNFAFVGRDYQKDIQSVVEFDEKLRVSKWPVRWEAIAIIDEFVYEERDFENWKNSFQLRQNAFLWGRSYFVHATVPQNGDPFGCSYRNYFISQVSLQARYAVAFAKNLSMLFKKQKKETTQNTVRRKRRSSVISNANPKMQTIKFFKDSLFDPNVNLKQTTFAKKRKSVVILDPQKRQKFEDDFSDLADEVVPTCEVCQQKAQDHNYGLICENPQMIEASTLVSMKILHPTVFGDIDPDSKVLAGSGRTIK